MTMAPIAYSTPEKDKIMINHDLALRSIHINKHKCAKLATSYCTNLIFQPELQVLSAIHSS